MRPAPMAMCRQPFPVLFVAINKRSGIVHELIFTSRVAARRYHKLMSEFYRNVRIKRAK
jgi:hypothetical protein